MFVYIYLVVLTHNCIFFLVVIPNTYFSNVTSVSLNESCMGGGCSMFIIFRNRDFCLAPANSILFDDGIVNYLHLSYLHFRHLCSGNLLHL